MPPSPNVLFDPQAACDYAVFRAERGSLGTADYLLRDTLTAVQSVPNDAYRQVWGPVVDAELANVLRLRALHEKNADKQSELLAEAQDRLEHANGVSLALYNASVNAFNQAAGAHDTTNMNASRRAVEHNAQAYGKELSYMARLAISRMVLSTDNNVRAREYTSARANFRHAQMRLREGSNDTRALFANGIHALYGAVAARNGYDAEEWRDQIGHDIRQVWWRDPVSCLRAHQQVRRSKNARHVAKVLRHMP